MAVPLRNIVRSIDWPLTAAICILIAVSLAVLFAIAGDNAELKSVFTKQCVFAGLGVFLYVVFCRIEIRKLRPFAPLFFVVAMAALILVLIFGQTIRNTTGWFSFGWLTLQPIEFVKILWILILASFIASKGQEMRYWKNIFIVVGLTVVLVGLTLLQPDLGSALIVIGITLGLLAVSRITLRQMLIIFLVLAVLLAASWFFFLREYQKQRILVLFSPTRDPQGRGYHVTQSIIAIGSGGWFGKGLGFGSQSQLKFLPEQQTDFIFAVIAEDLGLIGAGLTLIIFGFLIYRILRIAWQSADPFGMHVSFGIALLIFIHTFINIGMNIGLFPVAGIPLPFVSYGGSSLLSLCIGAGLIQSVRIQHQLRRRPIA